MSFALNGVGLTHANGFSALKEISLRAEKGERIALIGPSGAGKTSLLSVLGTALAPTVGTTEVLDFGQNFRLTVATGPLSLNPSFPRKRESIGSLDSRLRGNDMRALRSRIGTVHQSPPIPGRQRVVTAVLAGKLGQWPAWKSIASLLYPLDIPSARAALERVDLADKLFARCDQLSGGQLQRVGIARVLYQQPDLILADEPVSALDPALALATIRLLIAEAEARAAPRWSPACMPSIWPSAIFRALSASRLGGLLLICRPAKSPSRCCTTSTPAKVKNCRCRRMNRFPCYRQPPMMRQRGRHVAESRIRPRATIEPSLALELMLWNCYE